MIACFASRRQTLTRTRVQVERSSGTYRPREDGNNSSADKRNRIVKSPPWRASAPFKEVTAGHRIAVSDGKLKIKKKKNALLASMRCTFLSIPSISATSNPGEVIVELQSRARASERAKKRKLARTEIIVNAKLPLVKWRRGGGEEGKGRKEADSAATARRASFSRANARRNSACNYPTGIPWSAVFPLTRTGPRAWETV